MEHFNELTPAEVERLAILAEEMGEATQVVGKILRHGYDSTHPNDPNTTNQDYLEKELGDVKYIMERMMYMGDVNTKRINLRASEKAYSIQKYTHHQ